VGAPVGTGNDKRQKLFTGGGVSCTCKTQEKVFTNTDPKVHSPLKELGEKKKKKRAKGAATPLMKTSNKLRIRGSTATGAKNKSGVGHKFKRKDATLGSCGKRDWACCLGKMTHENREKKTSLGWVGRQRHWNEKNESGGERPRNECAGN